MTQSRLTVVPCELTQANEYVRQFHRHHDPAVGHRFSLAVVDDEGCVRGCAIVGRPVARMLQDGFTVEVNRLVTDGVPNGCSALYGAAWRSAKAMGYRRIVTYILDTETGVSLRASGWECLGAAGGGSWSVPSRPRDDHHPLGVKSRWQRTDGDPVAVVWPESMSVDVHPSFDFGVTA